MYTPDIQSYTILVGFQPWNVRDGYATQEVEGITKRWYPVSGLISQGVTHGSRHGFMEDPYTTSVSRVFVFLVYHAGDCSLMSCVFFPRKLSLSSEVRASRSTSS